MIDTVKQSVTIAGAGTLSNALAIPGQFVLSALIYPAMTLSTAFTFRVSLDGVTYTKLYNSSGAVYSVTIPLATVGAITLDPNIFYPWEFVELEVADAQTGAKIILCGVTSH